MRSNNLFVTIFLIVFLAACGGGGGGGGGGGTQPQLVSITITPAISSLPLGTTQQFVATGTYSDNSTKNITSSVTWTSTGATSQSITSSGLLTATATGTITITATLGSIAGTRVLTVTSVAANVVPITVNGSLCSAATSGNYFNKPCVSLVICTPGTSTCTTLTDVLVDTGSIGLRVFRSALGAVVPTPVSSGNGNLAECVQFADLSSLWGPVQIADVVLGTEPAVQIPIQVIDASFGNRAGLTTCQTPEATPVAAGFTAILGVGLFPQDCGTGCASKELNGLYFSCTSSSCTGVTVAQAGQVQNPVASLPQDNNGVLVSLPSVPLGGLPSLNGNLILGIGTQPNNAPSSVTTFPASANAVFTTTFNGLTFSDSFIDTGSNGIFFGNSTNTGLPLCSPSTSWYCPPNPVSLTATTVGATGAPSQAIPFTIGNFNSLLATGNNVFEEIGGPAPSGTFDWGLPFFYGRPIFVGISGRTTPIGTGPFWAY
ncbi:DUF3443 family protein [Geomesophilobacter sediminis]|uniref:DUF3443 family protein n=1 Tax=Geomesophilobacter sediminis TaxID=2798584 RepID=A0A8J7M0P5_9BACT|nr:DUF3443 family protein [Geomesophilobacter sediminis]MBJ6726267.1 DUF3443 family protein [Geomesophilobacter sediminis]